MTLRSNELTGFNVASAGVAASVSFTASTSANPAGTSQTFTSQSLGSAAAGRLIAVGVAQSDNGAPDATVSAMTVGGVSASSVVAANNTSEQAEIWIASVPSGATGDIAITFTNAAANVGIGVWALYNASATATHTITDTDSNPATGSLNVNAGGVAIGMANHRCNAAGTTFSWANLTENCDFTSSAGGDYAASGASAAFATDQVGLAISITSSTAGVRNPLLVAASFPQA